MTMNTQTDTATLLSSLPSSRQAGRSCNSKDANNNMSISNLNNMSISNLNNMSISNFNNNNMSMSNFDVTDQYIAPSNYILQLQKRFENPQAANNNNSSSRTPATASTPRRRSLKIKHIDAMPSPSPSDPSESLPDVAKFSKSGKDPMAYVQERRRSLGKNNSFTSHSARQMRTVGGDDTTEQNTSSSKETSSGDRTRTFTMTPVSPATPRRRVWRRSTDKPGTLRTSNLGPALPAAPALETETKNDSKKEETVASSSTTRTTKGRKFSPPRPVQRSVTAGAATPLTPTQPPKSILRKARSDAAGGTDEDHSSSSYSTSQHPEEDVIAEQEPFLPMTPQVTKPRLSSWSKPPETPSYIASPQRKAIQTLILTGKKQAPRWDFGLPKTFAKPPKTAVTHRAATQLQRMMRGWYQRLKFKVQLYTYKLNNRDLLTHQAKLAVTQDLEERKAQFYQAAHARAERRKASQSQIQDVDAQLEKEQQRMIAKLRKDNKKERETNEELVTGIRSMKEQNKRLEAANASTVESFDTLRKHAKKIFETHEKLRKVEPKYREAAERLQESVDQRDAYCRSEHKTRLLYVKLVGNLVTLLENHPQDDGLVAEILEMILQLEKTAPAPALPDFMLK